MPPVYQGDAFVSIKDFVFLKDRGLLESIREEGWPSIIRGRALGYKDQGYDVSWTDGGPFSRSLATRINPAAAALSPARWSVATEVLEKSIWGMPAVMAEMDTYPQAEGGRAKYRSIIEDSVNDASKYTLTQVNYPWAEKILLELRSGAEAYETEYTVLSRMLSFDFKTPPEVLDIETNRYIYTTGQLNARWPIPSEVKFTLPASFSDGGGDTENQTMWGWRIRDQEADITNGTTGTHRISWVYAQWSTFLYTPYGS